MTCRLDPRQQRTRTAVLAATRSVLRREGVQGASIDAIAAEAGVARSTLYRNWPDREHLLDDAIQEVVTPASPPDDRPPIERLTAVVTHLADRLDRSEWGATLPAIVAAADASPEFASRYRHVVDGRRAEVTAIIRDAVSDGVLPPTIDPDDLIDELVGPLFYRRLVRRVPTTPRWAARHVESVLAARQGAPSPPTRVRRRG